MRAAAEEIQRLREKNEEQQSQIDESRNQAIQTELMMNTMR